MAMFLQNLMRHRQEDSGSNPDGAAFMQNLLPGVNNASQEILRQAEQASQMAMANKNRVENMMEQQQAATEQQAANAGAQEQQKKKQMLSLGLMLATGGAGGGEEAAGEAAEGAMGGATKAWLKDIGDETIAKSFGNPYGFMKLF